MKKESKKDLNKEGLIKVTNKRELPNIYTNILISFGKERGLDNIDIYKMWFNSTVDDFVKDMYQFTVEDVIYETRNTIINDFKRELFEFYDDLCEEFNGVDKIIDDLVEDFFLKQYIYPTDDFLEGKSKINNALRFAKDYRECTRPYIKTEKIYI